MRNWFRRGDVWALLLLSCLGGEAGGQVSSGSNATGTTTGVIQGTVIDPTGAVISGGRVTATEESTGKVYRVITENNGFYKFSALKPGKYTVRFEMQGFKTETKPSVIVGSAQFTELNARLDVGYSSYVCSPCVNFPEIMVLPDADRPLLAPYTLGAIAGQVTDRRNEPIPQVRITLTGEHTGHRYQIATQCTGLYRLPGLVPGRYAVRFEAKGFRAYTKAGIHIGVDQVTQLDAKLKAGDESPQIEPPCEAQPTGSIAGTVTDPTGAVIPGAEVTVTEETTARLYRGRTDDSGLYRFSGLPPGKYTVRYEMKGFKTETRTSVIVNQSQVARVDVRLAVGLYSGPEITQAEPVEVCTHSCPIQIITPSPPHHGIALQIYAESNIINTGGSLWLTVLLSNTTNHPIFIHSEPGLARAFGYEIYVLRCGCPGRLSQPDGASSESNLRIPPGGSLNDRIDLSKLMDLSQAAMYTIFAQLPDTSNAVNNYEGIKDAPLVTSNSITVRVLAPY